MLLIDSHTHTFLRGPEDLEAMAIAGIEAVAVCAFLPVTPSGPATLLDHFRWLDEVERARLAELGLAMRLAVGVHPRCIPDSGLDLVLARVEALLNSRAAVAVGEVGLETGSEREREVLAAQLRLAQAAGVRAIVHTPRKNKAEALAATIRLIEAEGIDPSRVVLDHLTPDLVAEAERIGVWIGLTVQPGKLTYESLSQLVFERGPERLLVNSDLSHAPSDPLTVARVARFLWRAGHPAESIEKVTHRNAAKVLRLHESAANGR
ncbi:MAG: TatD family hydrolase [Myxococcales bacterium]|jgi:predicted metal-dependent TIM-barrel fold hydrolase